MDPLSALRDFTIRKDLDKIVSIGGDLHFGTDYTFPSSSLTSYRSKLGNLYSLETLLFFLRHQHLKHTDYLQSARLHRLPSVTLPDRKPLLDYLHGLTSSSLSIDHFPPQTQLSSIPTNISISTDPNAQADHDNNNNNSSNNQIPNQNQNTSVDFVTMIRSMERPLKDREALLESRNRDFYTVLVQSTKREEKRHKLESQQRKDGLVAKTRLSGADDGEGAMPKPKMMHLKGGKIGEGVPIILVPSASQTLITIYNVKEFLEDGVYVQSEAKMKGMGAKPECVTVQKKLSRDRAVAAYEVRDRTVGFKAEDWERVVAVFVLGKEWQFKDWPFKDHVEIFNKIIGFFVRFEDDSIESARIVKQWNVKIISISKNKRHQDRAAALEVWDRLEEFMRSRSHT